MCMKKSQKLFLFSKKTFVYLLCLLLFSFLVGCNLNENDDSKTSNENNSTYLKIVSNYDASGTSTVGYIYRIGLAGYSFEDLRITYHETKVFELNGIPGGYNNVNVNISFQPDNIHYASNSPGSIKCNFTPGKTTTITLTSSGSLLVSY